MAREIAALTGKTLKTPAIQAPATTAGDIQIHDLELCPFYSARKISGVKVAPSPDWLKAKLESVGLRPINNIVDVTNFVMFELGQPLHAFDAAKLSGSLQIRTAAEGEEFLALDGRTYKMKGKQLVIADQHKAVAIAGVMGGEDTGVTEFTTDVVLESAYFQPSSIRRTARDLGLGSDSSYRFERGVDPEGVLRASQRAIDLILQVAGGQAAPETIVAGAAPDFSCTITLRPNRCSEILGAPIPEEKSNAILSSLGLEQNGDQWRIPSYRQDLRREIDLIEEITRVYGIENIPGRELGRFTPSSASDQDHDRDMKLRNTLVGQGFFECRTLTLVAESAENSALKALGTGASALRVRNPLIADQVVLRPDLVGGLLGVVANNARVGVKSVRLFEIGRVFEAGAKEESAHLGLVMTGALNGGESHWRKSGDLAVDFYDLKGILASVGLGTLSFETIQDPTLALAVEIKSGGIRIGVAGQVWPAKARELDIASPILVAEIDLEALPALPRGRYQEINKFPGVTRDIAAVFPLSVSHQQISNALLAANEPLLVKAEIFDVFTDPKGEKIAADSKSLAYSLTYRAKDRTLTGEEVNAAHARLKERLRLELGAQFRE
jgi:phenylalanyl-tRNA synthetase beta chain